MIVYSKPESWVYNMWRPAIAWSYLAICLFDFLIAPIAHATFQAIFYPNNDFTSWQPITLSEGGLYHAAMMAIVGVTAWTRGQEKTSWIETFNKPEIDEEEYVPPKRTRRRRR